MTAAFEALSFLAPPSAAAGNQKTSFRKKSKGVSNNNRKRNFARGKRWGVGERWRRVVLNTW